jgi:hypothetical protein
MPTCSRISTIAFACVLASATVHAQATPVQLAVEGRANANPSIAARGAFVAVTWSAATTNAMDIFVATSRDGGRSFGAPVQVNAVAGDARVSGEQPPRVALVPSTRGEPAVVVVWTTKAGANWRLLSARSTDGGRTFATAVPVPGSSADGSRGWESIAVDAQGQVDVLWLDHRDLAMSAAAPMTHDMSTKPKADPTARAEKSQLYFAALDGRRPTAISITRSVCYCCKTSLVTAGSNVYAAWRHVYLGSYRDMAFTVSRDRGRTFAPPLRISEDHWQLDGCPDNGPALAVDRRQQVHVVWPTSPDGKDASSLAIFYARSVNGTSFSARTKLPTRGPAAHPQIVIDGNGSPVVTWDEIVDGTRRVALLRVQTGATGAVTFNVLTAPTRTLGAWYPVLASSSAGIVAAFVQQADNGSTIGVSLVK